MHKTIWLFKLLHGLTFVIYKILWVFLPTVRAGPVSSIILQALPAEQAPTLLVLPHVLGYSQAYYTA
jgi:hypothetical protein